MLELFMVGSIISVALGLWSGVYTAYDSWLPALVNILFDALLWPVQAVYWFCMVLALAHEGIMTKLWS